MEKFTGKVWVLDDDIDTDIIIPTEYLALKTIDDMKQYGFSPLRPELAGQIQKGDIIVADKNFGCGSSREHAPIAIKASGIPVVIAASFARIFYRNAINVGLPALEIGDDVEKIKAGDILSIDLDTGKIVDKTTGDTFQAPPLPGFIQDIAKAGGLINYVKESK